MPYSSRMSLTWRLSAISVVLTTLAACGSDDFSGAGTDTFIPPAESSDPFDEVEIDGDIDDSEEFIEEDYDPDMSAPPGLGWSGSIPVIDHDGYSYDADFQIEFSEPIADPTYAKPGEVEVSFTWSASLELTNTTPSREAPASGMTVRPWWPEDSEICTLGWANLQAADLRGPDDSGLIDEHQQPYCARYLALSEWSRWGQPVAIPEGESAMSSIEGEEVVLTVPEDSAAAVIEELRNPEVWTLESESFAGECTSSGSFSSTLHVLAMSNDTNGLVCDGLQLDVIGLTP